MRLPDLVKKEIEALVRAEQKQQPTQMAGRLNVRQDGPSCSFPEVEEEEEEEEEK